MKLDQQKCEAVLNLMKQYFDNLLTAKPQITCILIQGCQSLYLIVSGMYNTYGFLRV